MWCCQYIDFHMKMYWHEWEAVKQRFVAAPLVGLVTMDQIGHSRSLRVEVPTENRDGYPLWKAATDNVVVE